MGRSSEAYAAQQERDEYAREAALDLLEAAKEAKQILDCMASVAGMSVLFGAPEADSTADKLTRAIAKAEGRR